jgi:hypothetical protein
VHFRPGAVHVLPLQQGCALPPQVPFPQEPFVHVEFTPE